MGFTEQKYHICVAAYALLERRCALCDPSQEESIQEAWTRTAKDSI